MFQRKQHVWYMFVALILCACGTAPPQPTTPVLLHPTIPPSTTITVSATTPDGAHWYAFDQFDDAGGSSIYSQNQGLFRSKNGQVTHFDIDQTIRVLIAAPDGSLYLGAGCGIQRYRAGAWETLLDLDCNQPRTQMKGFFPIDIAIAADRVVWVGSAYSLGRFDGAIWQEYPVPSVRVALASDGTLWARGWDGRAGGECCLTEVRGTSITTHTLDADLALEPAVHNHLIQTL